MSSKWVNIWLVVVIVVLFATMLLGIQRDSLALDEGYTAWVIRDDVRDLNTVSDTIRYLGTSVLTAFERLRLDSSPPLYFVLLDIWSLIIGDSEFALRYPSALLAMMALAGMVAIGTQWFNRQTAFIAVLLLGTSGFFIFYSRDATPAMLYLALTITATAAYYRWWQKPTIWHGLIYIVLMTLALYSHYGSVLVFIVHMLHRFTQWNTPPRHAGIFTSIIPYLLVIILFAVWIPFINLSILVENILTANWTTVIRNSLFLTSPAWVLLLAYSIDRIRRVARDRLQVAIPLLLVIGIMLLQSVTINRLWSEKPDWREAVIKATETRAASEVGLLSTASHNPIVYYERIYPLTAGITIDIGWRQFTPTEVQGIATYLDNNASVWAILDMHLAQSWDAIAALADQRGVGYRDSVEGTIFYRFDDVSDENLAFQFGDINPIPVTWDYQTYSVGDTLCPTDFAIANKAYNIEISLIMETASSIFALATNDCLTVPGDEGILHVRLSLIDGNGQRLSVIENGNNWGDFLHIGTVANPENE